ncbi:hypothetical protein ACTFIZ_000020 [Dictyostelium cf. discoideum]
MFLSKFLLLALIAFLGISYNKVNANAGFLKPIPKIRCDDTETKGCKIRHPCHGPEVEGDVNPINVNSPYEFAIFQLLSKQNATSANTYTVQYFNDGDTTGHQLLTFNQNDMNQSSSFYAVDMDPISNNEKLMSNIQFDEKGFSFGTLELTFDARTGGGSVYYSCAFVRLQKFEPRIGKNSFIVSVDSTLILTDGKGDSLGTYETDQTKKNLTVPSLIAHDLTFEGSEIKNADDEINPNKGGDDSGHKNNSNKLFLSIAFIGLLSSLLLLLI